jgi:hypothetical protein
MQEILRLNSSQISKLGVDHQAIFGGNRSLEDFSIKVAADVTGFRKIAFDFHVSGAAGSSVEIREHEAVRFLQELEVVLFERGILPTDGIPRLIAEDAPAVFQVDGRTLEFPNGWSSRDEG